MDPFGAPVWIKVGGGGARDRDPLGAARWIREPSGSPAGVTRPSGSVRRDRLDRVARRGVQRSAVSGQRRPVAG